MPQEIFRQTNFNGGELDPRMRGRRDVKTYYAMLDTALNLVTTPAGIIERRPGTSFVDYIRHKLDAVPVLVGYIAAPNGGDPADLMAEAGDLFETANPLGALDQVILTLDFGAVVRIGLVDLVDYAVKEAAAPAPPEAPPFQYPYERPDYEFPSGPFA